MFASVVLVLYVATAVRSSVVVRPSLIDTSRSCRDNLAAANGNSGILGAFALKCEEDGSYSALQTYASAGMSFCVNSNGQTIVPPQRGLKACACPLLKAQHEAQQALNIRGGIIPQCDRDGTYSALQTPGSALGPRCVREDGSVILASRALVACKCIRARDLAQVGVHAGLVGRYIPQCQNDGTYSTIQANGSTGYQWCVDQEGVQIGEAVRPGQASKLMCSKFVAQPPHM